MSRARRASGGNAGAANRDLEAEHGVGLGRDRGQGAVQGGTHHRPGVLDLHTMPNPVGASRPACVDQPDVHSGAFELAGQHPGVDPGRHGHKGCAETWAEGGHGLYYSPLRARDLGRVAGEEVVFGLLGSETGDGRDDAKGVGGQEKDVFGRIGDARGVGVGDAGERVRAAGVFGNRVVVEVQARVSRSMVTFSRIVPNWWVVA